MNKGNYASLFIIWGKEVKLSQYLAQELAALPCQVYYEKFLSWRMPAAIRYIFQTVKTWQLLLKHRPSLVIVQNPPFIAPLVCLPYCKLFKAKLMIDSHTAAFLDRKWERLSFLFRFVAKRANLNTCHNFKNLEILKSWGIKPSMVLQFFNPEFDRLSLSEPLSDENLEKDLQGSECPILMVNRFASDDDFETVFETARLMPEADFYITGDYHKLAGRLGNIPKNIVLTGYLKHQDFMRLMDRSEVVLAFTLRPDTVLWSIREIMALRKPFVTTDSEVMRHYFGEVGLFAKSDPLAISSAITEALEKSEDIKQGIDKFLNKDKDRWKQEMLQVKENLQIL